MKRPSLPTAEQNELGTKRPRSSTEDMTESMDENGKGHAHVSLHQAFDELANQYPSRPAVEDDSGNSWTYAELQAASIRAAAGMMTYKTENAQRSTAWPAPVALLMKRTCAWVAAAVAAMRAAVPSLSLSGDLRNAEESQRNQEALADHQPFLLVFAAVLRDALPPTDGKSTMQIVDVADLLAWRGPETPVFSFDGRHPDDVLYILYTGGTTSASKSVAVTHRMALHELKTYPQIAPLQCTDRVLHQTSAYWGATSLGIFDVAWACGGCLVLTEAGAGPAEVAAIVSKASITTMGVVPSVLEALEPEQCPTVRVIFTWGEALSSRTAARWAARTALLDLLIASEYWLILVSDHRVHLDNASKNGGHRKGFQPIPGARLTLLAPDREGASLVSMEEVPVGEVGELYMAGPTVSAVGYTEPAKNRDAFVDLPVGEGGSIVRHFRTRDLARRLQDGSLEYCGRADGFAKVGGKWLDLAAVERRLLAAGCENAALVWDERAKMRHAAVVLEKSATTQRSFSQCIGELQRLLPRDTNLHVRAALPHNLATGKLHRGRLVEELATENAGSSSSSSSSCLKPKAAAARKAGRALIFGLLLAGRTGARGAHLASMAWRLAPGMRPRKPGHRAPALAGLPEGLAENIEAWAAWHRAVGSCLPAAALGTLPHIALLLLDAQDTGLGAFTSLLEGPVGVLGAAMLVSHCAKPWLRWLLAAAGSAHAHRARGALGWRWSFWIGWPVLAAQWEADCWTGSGRTKPHAVVAGQFLLGLRDLFRKKLAGPLPRLSCCTQCGRWVTDGAPWQNQFYCSKCNDAWDRYMDGDETALADDVPMPPSKHAQSQGWRTSDSDWTPGVSEIDFTDSEVERARAALPSRNSHSAVVSSSKAAATTPVGRIVERCAGIDGSDSASSLASLESLKVISVVSAIRRELGVALAAGDVVRCSCLGDLEELCAKVQAAAEAHSKNGREQAAIGNGSASKWAIVAIPRFWKAPVGWLIRLDHVPKERAMRAAACALVKRHPGLRAQPYSKKGDEAIAEMCLRAAPIVIVLRNLLGDYAQGFISKASDGFQSSWPLVTVTPPRRGCAPEDGPEVANFEWLTFPTMAQLRSNSWLRSRSRGFKLPAQVAVLVLGGSVAIPTVNGKSITTNGNHDVAYLHVAVNHAVCDAFCIVPLVADLLALHDAAVKVESTGPQASHIGELADKALEVADLPPMPDGMALQQVRLEHALSPSHGAGDAQDLAHNIFCPRRRGYDHYVRLMEGACALLEVGSATIGVPPDHLLVTAIAAAFACISKQLEVKISLIVPMRDGAGEGQVIGNLATTRHLELWFGGRSSLAVALDLSTRLRRREWHLCDVIDEDGDRLFVNVRDIPKLEGAAAVMEDVNTKSSKTRFVRNVMEMFVDRESAKSWAFSIGIREDLNGQSFAQALKQALWNMAVEPLGVAIPVLPLPEPESVTALAEGPAAEKSV